MNILLISDSYPPEIRSASKLMQELAEGLKADPEAKANIVGHADSIGSDAYNDALSLRRAESAKRYLVETYGISPDRIHLRAMGKRAPLATNAGPWSRVRRLRRRAPPARPPRPRRTARSSIAGPDCGR